MVDLEVPTRRERATAHRAHPRRRRWVRLVVWGLLVAVVGWAVWLVVDGLRARHELNAAAALVSQMQRAGLSGDVDVVDAHLATTQEHARAALDATHGPHWSVARWVPWLGGHVDAVQATSEVVHGLTTSVLPDLVEVSGTMDPATLVPAQGRVDVQRLAEAAPVVTSAAAGVDSAAERLTRVQTTGLVGPIARPVERLREQVGELAALTSTAAKAVTLLPPMLGAEGPRTYLLLVQNPAEPRATGGIPILTRLRADDGLITLVDQQTAAVGNLREPVVPLTDEEMALFGPQLGSYLANVTLTPDFPRSGELAAAIWEHERGETLDGVLSIDPVALGLMLEATGPVTTPDGTALTAETAPTALMNTIYLDSEDKDDRDEFFMGATGTIFDAVLSADWPAAPMVDALAEAARQGRVMVWSAHDAEQERLNGTVLSGELRGSVGDTPVIGLYVNDGTASKIGYYLDADVVTTTSADGTEIIVEATFTSTAPPDAGTYPRYVAGDGRNTEPGNIRANVLLYAPTGGVVREVQRDGEPIGVHSSLHDGLQAVGTTLDLQPGQAKTLHYSLQLNHPNHIPPNLTTTPLAGKGT
ncbi:hypothetical protein N869_13565 [Cellulomonas bogoriensis 69B4 = DSM 16987]|uniref:Peptide synthetase n=1 Tax=Cellulomonas bogoriensis 69B4 = DSM 16987 TaxID=1386082 RepID=A0A0A0BYM2_9CELL|nr:hypothetical protein N869_13565 [Cellulomonas bogoriensis 69B4 = DSM 16987]